MKTPWQRAQDRRPKYALQESRAAKKPGATAQVNSGRTWSSLRDVKLESPLGRVLIDNKTTETASSYRITEKDWLELRRDANRTPPGCHPALQIDLSDRVRLMTIEEPFWDEILDYIRVLEDQLEH
jgi:hypothetical protein